MQELKPLIQINKIFDKQRIDKVAIYFLENTTRSQIKNLILDGCLTINNKVTRPKDVLHIDDEIWISTCCIQEKEQDLLPNKEKKIDILYETPHYLIVNKPFDCVTHPDSKHKNDSLVNYVLATTKLYVNKNDVQRSGIVHRLDKDTTGILILVKTNEAYNFFVNMFKKQTIIKKYIAIIKGSLSNEELLVRLPIARSGKNRLKMAIDGEKGKIAITKIRLLEKFNNYSLIECELQTGRTHQIRVHLEYMKTPILNDRTYGKQINDDPFGQYLHSYFLEFIDPFSNKMVQIVAEPPKQFKNKMKELGLKWKI